MMKENLNQLGLRIREMREICDYSVAQVADELRVNVEIYEEYEKCGDIVRCALAKLQKLLIKSLSIL